MNKTEARALVRAKKRAMTQEQIETASRELGELLRQHPLYQNARTIYFYLPYNQEVRTTWMIQAALEEGKQVAVPKCYGDTMKFLYIKSLEGIQPGYCGIPEPVFDEPVADDPTALVLMPGLAFDRKGSRIGYGGGFYDKFLASEPEHPTLALCYGFQMLEELESDPYDVPVDAVIWTEVAV